MKYSPVKTIIFFFIVLTLVGTALLCLPFARQSSAVFSFITCLFTATSAVCVTGLSVVNVGTYFSTFGQWVILILIQVGGLGYMLVSTGLGLILGKMALKDRKIMQEIFDISSFDDLFKLLRKAVLVVFGIEFIGAAVLTFVFLREFPLGRAVYLGIFHSVSAFCNAGFSLFSTSLEGYSSSPAVLYTIALLIILGGLGFFVLVDIIDKFRGKNIRLTFHSKVILWMTGCLIVFGLVTFLLSDGLLLLKENKSLSFVLNNSFFQTVSARTAGFNSLPPGLMTTSSVFVIMILMFIGGGPGSTAGGLKLTTLALVFVFIRSTLKGSSSFPFAGKSMDEDLIKKALAVFALMMFFIFMFISALLWTDQNLDPFKIIFEAVSGFCTVGLSLGITSDISNAGRIVLILAMFVGRIGAITILVYLLNSKFVQSNIKYPEGKLLIG